jgi:hypothetical protein
MFAYGVQIPERNVDAEVRLRRLARSLHDETIDRCFVDTEPSIPWPQRPAAKRLLHVVQGDFDAEVLLDVSAGMTRSDLDSALALLELHYADVIVDRWGPIRASSKRYAEIRIRLPERRIG